MSRSVAGFLQTLYVVVVVGVVVSVTKDGIVFILILIYMTFLSIVRDSLTY